MQAPGDSAPNGQQLDLEVQRGVGRDHAARAALAVGNGGWAGQLGLATGLHALYALGPAGDHAVEGKLGGLAALVGAVELLAVEQGAFVMDLDGIGGLGRLARAFLDRFKHHAAGRGHRGRLRQRHRGQGQRRKQGEQNAHEESSGKNKGPMVGPVGSAGETAAGRQCCPRQLNASKTIAAGACCTRARGQKDQKPTKSHQAKPRGTANPALHSA